MFDSVRSSTGVGIEGVEGGHGEKQISRPEGVFEVVEYRFKGKRLSTP